MCYNSARGRLFGKNFAKGLNHRIEHERKRDTAVLHKKLPDRNGRGVQRRYVKRSGVLLLGGDLGEKLLGIFCHLALAAPAAHRHRNCRSGVWIVVAATDRALAIIGLSDLTEKSGRVLFELGQTPTTAESDLNLDGSAPIGGFAFHRTDFIYGTSEGGGQGQYQPTDNERNDFHRFWNDCMSLDH